jgi:hypothetical protein
MSDIVIAPPSYCVPGAVKTLLASCDLAKWDADLAAQATSVDELLETEIIPDVSAMVAQFCQRPFHSVTETRYFRGSNSFRLILGRYPVTEITTLKIYMLVNKPWWKFPIDRIGYINCTDPNTGVQWREPSTEAEVQQCVVKLDVGMGWLMIDPNLILYGITSTPFWNYSWLSPSYESENIEIALTHGTPEDKRPRSVTTAVACLSALMCLPMIDAANTGGMVSWGLGDEKRQWGGAPADIPEDDFFGQFRYRGVYSALGAGFLARARAGLRQWKVNIGIS